jgi:hypothetical protein
MEVGIAVRRLRKVKVVGGRGGVGSKVR